MEAKIANLRLQLHELEKLRKEKSRADQLEADNNNLREQLNTLVEKKKRVVGQLAQHDVTIQVVFYDIWLDGGLFGFLGTLKSCSTFTGSS